MFRTLRFLLKGIFKYKLNLLATLKLNFKYLTFKEALIFPICIYGKFKFYDLAGNIEIRNPLSFGLIRIGQEISKMNGCNQWSCLTLNGNIIFNGHAYFDHNSNIEIKKTGTLTLGRNVYLGPNVRIICENSICFGDHSRIAWDSQIYDTNFHYLINHNTSSIMKKHSPIYIGDYCWIGNRVTITKGTYICNYTIISANSLINKDYRQYGECSILAGIPAKFITKDMQKISNISIELKLDEYFHSNEVEEVDINSKIIKEILSVGLIHSVDGKN